MWGWTRVSQERKGSKQSTAQSLYWEGLAEAGQSSFEMKEFRVPLELALFLGVDKAALTGLLELILLIICSGVLGTGLPGLGTEHLPGALCSGTGSPALGLCSP